MIRHMVFVKVRPDVDAAEVAAILANLDALRDVVSGMLAFAGGPNVSPEHLSQGYTHAFACDFADGAARDSYLAHPAHRAAGARLVAATQGGPQGLAVIDVEVAGQG